MVENTPVPSGRGSKRPRQDLNDADSNLAVPGASTANLYRYLAVRFVNDPQSKFIKLSMMESSAGRSRVMIELEIVDTA